MIVDILKARLKAARQRPNQDIFAFLCDFRTLAQRTYRALLHLVEQIVLTSFIECLSDSTLRWELRKSKPAISDDALYLAIDMNSFLEIEKGALSTSEMAEASVNLISREAPEPSTKEWMDELVRTQTEGFKNAMPMPSQERSRQWYSTQNRNQPSQSNSTDDQETRTVQFQNSSIGERNSNNQDNNWRGSNCQNTNSNQPNDNKNNSKGPCKHWNVTFRPRTIVKLIWNTERLDTCAMNAETKRPTIYTENVYARGSTHRQRHFTRPTSSNIELRCWSPECVHSNENLWSHNWSDMRHWSKCIMSQCWNSVILSKRSTPWKWSP